LLSIVISIILPFNPLNDLTRIDNAPT